MMIVPIEMWNEKVGNNRIKVVGKRFWYRGKYYKYTLLKGFVEIEREMTADE